MPEHVHGTDAYSADELVSLLGDRLGLVFSERDSHFPADWLLLLTTTSVEDAELPARLDSIEGIVRMDGPL
ncbi:hypothetical protein ABZ568_22920 [Streptomyces olindensis]|uniref:Uncharacterized protein n=1 Tax=Streptomyces olindensis TaxID=358823 RepID=A0ABV2XYX1_9ACTN